MKKAEVCSCVEGEQKAEYYLGQAVNPLKPEVIHRNYRANSTDPVVKLNFSFYSFLGNCSGYWPFLNILLSILPWNWNLEIISM